MTRDAPVTAQRAGRQRLLIPLLGRGSGRRPGCGFPWVIPNTGHTPHLRHGPPRAPGRELEGFGLIFPRSVGIRNRLAALEVLVWERPQGTYVRRVFLGEALDVDNLKANYDNGVLVLRAPKPESERSKVRKIEVQ